MEGINIQRYKNSNKPSNERKILSSFNDHYMFQLTWNTSMSTIDTSIVLQALYKSPKLKSLDSQVMLWYVNSCKGTTSHFGIQSALWLWVLSVVASIRKISDSRKFLSVLLSLCSAETKKHSALEIAQQKRKNNSWLQDVLEAVQTWRSGILKIPQDLGNSQFQQLAPLWTF